MKIYASFNHAGCKLTPRRPRDPCGREGESLRRGHPLDSLVEVNFIMQLNYRSEGPNNSFAVGKGKHHLYILLLVWNSGVSGFHERGANFCWPLVLTQKRGKPCLPFFAMAKYFFDKEGPWPNALPGPPLNTPPVWNINWDAALQLHD